ncbi:MAG: DUF5011 domain-containing protein [Clostridia bacterium]|nr:DUF5011 domain-containing protein [Clostridia bacterium]
MDLKKKGNILFWIIAALLAASIALYGILLIRSNKDRAPVLYVPEGELKISVNDPISVLMEGLKATDSEDGDVTPSILIESVSAFDENMKRTVTYAAFDSNYHVSRATREFSYFDYVPPVFSISDSLSMVTWNNADILKLVGAEDMLDGDLSQHVAISDYYLIDSYKGIYEIRFTVSNSAGDTSEITSLIQLANVSRLMPVIKLTDYIVYIDAGTEFDPMKYIKSAVSGNDSSEPRVNCVSDVKSDTPGCYTVTYNAVNSIGYEGCAFLTVVVR